MSYYSIVDYTGNGTTTDFTVTFPYIEKAHVVVKLANIVQTAYTWVNSTLIRFNSPPGGGLTVRIQRETPVSPLVSFQNGSVLTGADLNTAITQMTYLAQENTDLAAQILNNAVTVVSSVGNVPAPNNPGDDNKVLRALSAAYAWTDTISLTSITTQTLVVTGSESDSGSLGVTGDVTAGGNLSVTGNGSVGGTLTVNGSVTFSTGTGSDFSTTIQKSTVNATIPKFVLKHPSATPTVLVLSSSDGTTSLDFLAFQRSSGQNVILHSTHIVPSVDASYDLGGPSNKLRGIYVANGGLHSSRIGASILMSAWTVAASGTPVIATLTNAGISEVLPVGASSGFATDGYTVRKSGLYWVSAWGRSTSTTAGSRVIGVQSVSLGVFAASTGQAGTASTGVELLAGRMVYLAAGDKVSMWIEHSFSTSTTYASGVLDVWLVAE